MTAKRYELSVEHGSLHANEAEDGEYVLATDYDALQREAQGLREDAERWRCLIDSLMYLIEGNGESCSSDELIAIVDTERARHSSTPEG